MEQWEEGRPQEEDLPNIPIFQYSIIPVLFVHAQ